MELATGEASYTNARPDISVKVVKRSANDDVTLEGAVFGLYAESDISSYDGNVIVSKGTLIEQAVSDVDGNAVFKADIPLGFQYSVQEIQAPDLYYMSMQFITLPMNIRMIPLTNILLRMNLRMRKYVGKSM